MTKLNRSTQKLYYTDFYLSQTRARVVKVGVDFVELDATVAFPEGGGQESDRGVIVLGDGSVLRFIETKRLYGNFAGLAEFSGLQVDGVIWHVIHPDDRAMLGCVAQDAEVTVQIDVARRARLSLSHTASHLLYLGIGLHRPDAIEHTIGCHIKEDGARFDFGVAERFTAEQIALIEARANELVQKAAAITVSAHETVPDARLWHCEGQVIACGGTHLDNASAVGPLQVRRKSVGAGKERLACSFPDAVFDLARYHA